MISGLVSMGHKVIKGLGICIRGLKFLSNRILQPRQLSYEKLYEKEVSECHFDENRYQAMKKVEFEVESDYGYTLACELLETNSSKTESPKKIAVLCHGYTSAKCACLKYAEIYFKLGYTVIIYDHRNHGLSGKAYTTMGYYEKHDLKKVIDWCFEKYGEDCTVITHGESMGAATVLLHIGIDDRVKCVVSDCAYSDLKQLLKYQLKRYYHLPVFLIPLVSLITYLRAGFLYKQVSPIQVVKETDKPILFIHGMEDHFVPTNMSKEMYESKKDKKVLYLVAEAKHAESCLIDKEDYENKVKDFLDTYLSI